MKQPRSLSELTLDEFEEWVKGQGLPAYRARQVFEWVFEHGVSDYQEMTNLSRRLREQLAGQLPALSSKVAHEQKSADGTLKLLVRLHDGESLETVMIPDGERRTVCISSQVGCGMGCVFCASGLFGLKRQLSAGEIVEQVLHMRRAMHEGERVSHLVFMGMGEPLGNYSSLERAIRIFNADWGCGIGRRHMTVSTVGMLGQAKKLARDHPQVTLAISLHAPNDDIRRKIVPTAKKVTVDDLIEGAREYFRQTGRKITFEYCLLGGLNSRREHAVELADRLRDLNCYVNLIPWNPVDEIDLKAPTEDEVEVFAKLLRSAGAEVAIRRQRGADIDAACGQLKLKEETLPILQA